MVALMDDDRVPGVEGFAGTPRGDVFIGSGCGDTFRTTTPVALVEISAACRARGGSAQQGQTVMIASTLPAARDSRAMSTGCLVKTTSPLLAASTT